MSHLKDVLDAHDDWIAPRGDQHTVLGIPQSSEHRKTFVEPGGSFSPGVATFGVSLWLYDRQAGYLYTPEELPLTQLDWHWEEGYLPILNSSWQAGKVRVEQQLFAVALFNAENVVNSLKVVLTGNESQATHFECYLVIRPYGPAGGRIHMLATPDRQSLEVNGKTVMLAKNAAMQFGAVSYQADQQDVSFWLKRGEIPMAQRVTDDAGLCGGAFLYHGTLLPGERHTFEFDFFVHPLEQRYLTAFRRYHEQTCEAKLASVLEDWRKRLDSVQLQVPDERFQHAYISLLAQFLMGMVRQEVRIATVTYPLFWLRDGVYIIQALDKAGFHEEVRAQLELLRPRIFAGGFGAEPDAFGEGIWAFFTHFQLTRDRDWLARVYPDIQARGEWIIRALHTEDYLYADVEMRIPQNKFAAETDLICAPARDGLIQGRMDWHRPLIWINAFAYQGLSALAEMAEVTGHPEDSTRYRQEAHALQQSLYAYAQNAFGENERDFVCALWPTHAFSSSDEWLVARYETWWHNTRLQNRGEYTVEPLWKYFELGQAHNYLFLGERGKTLQTVEQYLTHQDVHNLYGWLEDNHDVAESWSLIEGWYKLPSRQPHGWVASEFWLLLRDMLFYEKNDQLVLGAGVPAAWMQYSTPLVLSNAPSTFGPLDLRVTRQDHHIVQVKIHFHELEHLPQQIEVRLPWKSQSVKTAFGTCQLGVILIFKEDYETTGFLDIQVIEE